MLAKNTHAARPTAPRWSSRLRNNRQLSLPSRMLQRRLSKQSQQIIGARSSQQYYHQMDQSDTLWGLLRR